MGQFTLGLDLGTNSIGWAVVENENGHGKILDSGVRIFPEGITKDTIGKGDKEKSKNATRRDSRQSRKQFYRKRLRKIKLLEVLIEQGMCPLEMKELKKWKNWNSDEKSAGRVFPSSEEFVAWIKLNPYQLRAKALSEALSLKELGRIFYHLIQRRGFFSSRKGGDDPKTLFEKGKPEENILPINETLKYAKDSTLGSYLNSISHKDNTPYKTMRDENGKEIRVRGRYTTRDMYLEEFEKIWQVQSGFLDLDERVIEVKKTREIRGNLSNKRNSNKIENLQKKYGKENFIIGNKSDKNITKVITFSKKTLKEFLAGKVEEVETETGEKLLKVKSQESTLFWQRPLKSHKGLLAPCRFESSKKPCPLSHPEFEEFRSYQFVNNIKYGTNPKLTDEEREKIIALINKNDKNFDFVKIPKELKLTYEKFNYDNKQKVPGNYTIKHLSTLFDKKTWQKHSDEIWHCFYFYDDDDKLFEKLRNSFSYKGDFNKIKKIKLKDGYSSVSLKAIRNITPFLKLGYTYDKAVILGGVRNAFGEEWEKFSASHELIIKDVINILKENNAMGEAIEKIKDYLGSPVDFYGFSKGDARFSRLYHHSQEIEQSDGLAKKLPEVENLRNPIVQSALYEMRRLVNMLMKKYQKEFGDGFHFNQIKVEMGRDLKNNKEGRQKASLRIKDNTEKNNEARERLQEYGLQPSRLNIQKFIAWKEIEEKNGSVQCPYTGKTVSISELLGRNGSIQVEHINPYSISLDDGFANKTICDATFNNLKGEKTPYQFYKDNSSKELWGVSSWGEVRERAFKLLPYNKAKRFTNKKDLEKSTFIERQLNDTRYIAKKSVELLSTICKDVRVMPGQLTAELRHLWGLNNILQPTKNINSLMESISTNKPVENVYAVVDENSITQSIHLKDAKRPTTDESEMILPTTVKKEKDGYELSSKYSLKTKDDKFTSKYMSIDFKSLDIEDGRYWVKLVISENIKLIPKFIPKPQTDENSIVFRGKVEREIFKNETTGNIKNTENNGVFWAKFTVLDKKLIDSKESKERPKTKSQKQIALFGNVHKGRFKCYVYTCSTDLPDGKYWIILDLDYPNVTFEKAVNTIPKTAPDEICITATVDNGGVLTVDADRSFQRCVDEVPGRYFATLKIESKNIESKNIECFPVENNKPVIEDGEKLVEGSIWIDKHTGELQFDPKKNRTDNRHHAIDAITIALTEQSYLQKLSTYNANRKSLQRGTIVSTEKFPEPWDGFNKDVQKAVNKILVSYKKNNKILTKSKRGDAVRGKLHDATYYGKKKYCKENQYTTRININKLKYVKSSGTPCINDVVDAGVKKVIEKYIEEKLDETKKVIFKEIKSREANINSVKNKNKEEKYINDLKKKIKNDVENIIEKGLFFLENSGKRYRRLKKEDKNFERTPVPIKKVKIIKSIASAKKLKELNNRETQVQYVDPQNNHHVMIYKDQNGELKEEVVQFWTAVNRQKAGESIYQVPEGGTKVTTLETNDMFILGLTDEQFKENQDNHIFLSEYLYRVQKLGGNEKYREFCFRHHLDSRSDQEAKKDYIFIKNFKDGKTGWKTYSPIKVYISELGEIKKV